MQTESLVLKVWGMIGGNQIGRWFFAKLVCWRVPYFSTISPSFITYSDEIVEVAIKKKRSVTNHLGTIHVIAVANLCELAAGTLMEAGLVSSMRWIPKGMSISYLLPANTYITARAVMPEIKEGEKADVIVPVTVTDTNEREVVRADIVMYLTPRKKYNR